MYIAIYQNDTSNVVVNPNEISMFSIYLKIMAKLSQDVLKRIIPKAFTTTIGV